MADPTNRYADLPVLTWQQAGEAPVRYYQRRIVPQPASFTVAQEAVVTAGDRPDLMAARVWGNPLLFWRIADANGRLDPFDLTAEAGTVLSIPAPGP
jgi:hypothetical protein